MANNMKDYQKMFEEETVRLFDNSKIKRRYEYNRG